MVTQNDILSQLENLKKKDRRWLKPEDYKKFLPSGIPNVPEKPKSDLYKARMQSVADRANTRTEIAQVHAANQAAYEQMRAARRALRAAQAAANSAGGFNPNNYINKSPGGGIVGNVSGKGKWKDPTPFNINSGIGTYKWRGRNLTVNRSMANNFIGFLNALSRTGYKIHSIGTYANRNIAGTNVKSLHSLGLAMDINPTQNPVSYGKPVTNLPRGVGRLASKYGLVWGGNWNGPKYDAMHFSKPYGGRK